MKTKFIFIFLLIFSFNSVFSQKNNAQKFFNHLKPAVINPVLDSVSINDISFAHSLRRVKSNYKGFCIKLRRSIDSVEMNFGFNGNGLVDTSAIFTFKGSGKVYVVKWYDQSGLNRDAVQDTIRWQPEFFSSARNNLPLIKFDGTDDFLLVPTSLQVLTTSGADGTVFYVGNATSRNQVTFGSNGGGSRWFTHLNWSTGEAFFDPGNCCNTVRSFNNITRVDSFDQFTFLRNPTTITIKQNGAIKATGLYTLGASTSTVGFSFGAAWNGTTATSFSNNSFQEIFMFKKEIIGSDLSLTEANQVLFWQL